jgi:carbamoylphosphate synthase small subunit
LLLPEHDEIVMDLLFEMATWHSLAKLRLHTESTVTALEVSTSRLGTALRKFVLVTCEEFDTRELPSEEAQRGRRKAALAKKKCSTSEPAKKKRRLMTTSNEQDLEAGANRRKFSLNTYKLHLLGDYPNTIRSCGTANNYNL